MVLPPHEDAAPVRQVVRHDRQPVPPGLHHRLHVVEAVVPAQVGRLQARIYLRSFLKLDDLLGSLGADQERSYSWGRGWELHEDLPPRLTAQSPEPKRWKERTDSAKLSSDLWAKTHTQIQNKTAQTNEQLPESTQGGVAGFHWFHRRGR